MELYCALEELQCALGDFVLHYGVMFCIGLVIFCVMGLYCDLGSYMVRHWRYGVIFWMRLLCCAETAWRKVIYL